MIFIILNGIPELIIYLSFVFTNVIEQKNIAPEMAPKMMIVCAISGAMVFTLSKGCLNTNTRGSGWFQKQL